MADQKKYAWAVVGAGPGGMTAVGLLLDAGIAASEILWIDPDFTVGDFGNLWGEVNSNTKVSLFLDFLTSVKSFEYSTGSNFSINKRDINGFTPLKLVSEPLQWVSDKLKKKVSSITGMVKSLDISHGMWQLNTDDCAFLAEKVILSTGSEPKSLSYPGVKEIDLVTALTPGQLKEACTPNETIAVFGSSHSAMIIIRNLVEAGVNNIVNFYQSPLKFAVLLDDWILYDDTGLKGETAQWVKEYVSKNKLPQLKRYVANEDNINQHLPLCNQAIFAVGFERRSIPISGISASQYDNSNGIIAPGLFGAGIAFPVVVTDPFGRRENNVGLWKFLKNMRKTLPIWQQYGL